MKPIVEMIEAAEREVLAHTIESTRGLRAFFCQHGGEELMSSLQEEAVRRGLYRYMGQRYAEAWKCCSIARANVLPSAESGRRTS